MAPDTLPIIDLFAGPGGLGEGFASLAGTPFKIIVSAEKDRYAHQTLQLRAYYRYLLQERPEELHTYLNFCNGSKLHPWNHLTQDLWHKAEQEALLIELGSSEGNSKLDQVLEKSFLKDDRWVLIGGPPCQAYSLMGRSRNKGNPAYSAERDHRHFLYKEYLRILQKYRPSVFVMENVKGILSSTVNDELIFHTILRDLTDPDAAMATTSSATGYRIFSLTKNVEFGQGDSLKSINPHDFVIRMEDHGIPQARHRVILLGVREDMLPKKRRLLAKKGHFVTVEDVLKGLPPLRSRLSSRLSNQQDSAESWQAIVRENASYLLKNSLDQLLKQELEIAKEKISSYTQTGGLRFPDQSNPFQNISTELDSWFSSNRPDVWLNHETRGHMESDLKRYLFASAFSKVYGYSPKGADDFNIDGLRPDHKNWESGHFSDRFRVQIANKPATTITSHIAKDGHYYIHYDPSQCRSLTVREAARLQTFPDNYFFQGNKTQQYHQVGNAVPPYLANQIAKIVYELLSE